MTGSWTIPWHLTYGSGFIQQQFFPPACCSLNAQGQTNSGLFLPHESEHTPIHVKAEGNTHHMAVGPPATEELKMMEEVTARPGELADLAAAPALSKGWQSYNSMKMCEESS